jgi:hypothetical protein
MLTLHIAHTDKQDKPTCATRTMHVFKRISPESMKVLKHQLKDPPTRDVPGKGLLQALDLRPSLAFYWILCHPLYNFMYQ